MDVGLSSCGNKLKIESFFADCASNGIGKVEISCSAKDMRTLDVGDTVGKAKENDVEIRSLHLPFMPFDEIDVSSTDEALRSSTLTLLEGYIRDGAANGIRHFIVHPSGEPIRDEDRAERMKRAKESLYTLAKTADECGAVIAVEDLPRTCLGRNSTEILGLLSVSPSLRCCFDTNHLLTEDPVAFIRAVGDKIVTTHVSDYDVIDEKHWLPGEGKLDWTSLINALKEVGYSGPWLYELGFGAPKSRPRSRNLTCADFRRNADELFAAKPLTVIE